jgi:hypothetical protein
VVTSPDPFQARLSVQLAQQISPGIDIVVCTHTDVEQAHLAQQDVGI